MALVPLEVLLDRSCDDCPACRTAAAAPPAYPNGLDRPKQYGCHNVAGIGCICDPLEPHDDRQIGPERRQLAGGSTAAGHRMH